MVLFFKKAHNLYYIFTAVCFLVLFYPLLYFFSRKQSRYPFLNHLRRLCCFLSSTASGIFYNIKYEERVDWSRAYIVCPNHTSNLDILSMSLTVKNNFHFISKDELLSNPLFGLFLRSVDIPVNRNSNISAFKAFKKAADNLKHGMSLVIFPEGKIGDDYPPVLHPFKNGPFKLAIELGIPIIPVTSLNTWHIQWDSGFKLGSRPGICNIFVHKPIETKGLTLSDSEELKNKVYKIINDKFAWYDY